MAYVLGIADNHMEKRPQGLSLGRRKGFRDSS